MLWLSLAVRIQCNFRILFPKANVSKCHCRIAFLHCITIFIALFDFIAFILSLSYGRWRVSERVCHVDGSLASGHSMQSSRIQGRSVGAGSRYEKVCQLANREDVTRCINW